MTESAWWNQYKILRTEVDSTASSFNFWKSINKHAAENPVMLRQMNKNAEFWNVMMHALQTTFIITIGRVFDKDPRSHSIQKLLTEMAEHPEYFAKQELETRKRELSHGGDVIWLNDYLRDAWEPSTTDLGQLRDSMGTTINKYESVYQPIRHKMFAHKDIGVDINALLGKSLISDIDEILYALHDMLENIFQLYMNGIKPALGVKKYDYERRHSDNTLDVMKIFGSADL